MNWCGCTNYFSTGNYRIVAPFICSSEKAAIKAAFQVIQDMGDKLSHFSHHLAGTPLMNVVREALSGSSTGRKNKRDSRSFILKISATVIFTADNFPFAFLFFISISIALASAIPGKVALPGESRSTSVLCTMG